jgi:ribosomal-protein-alanine N-acetyltransferase
MRCNPPGLILCTDRTRLRKPREEDMPRIRAFIGELSANRYFRSIAREEFTKTKEFEKPQLETNSFSDHRAMAVADQSSDVCIGLVGYHHYEVSDARLEIGYALSPEYRGRGLMKEALLSFVNYCFQELSVHRIDALIRPENLPSIRLATRIGFRCEGGPLRDYEKVGDGYTDLMIYGLLRSDFGAT